MSLLGDFGRYDDAPNEGKTLLGRLGNAAWKLNQDPNWQQVQARQRGENPWVMQATQARMIEAKAREQAIQAQADAEEKQRRYYENARKNPNVNQEVLAAREAGVNTPGSKLFNDPSSGPFEGTGIEAQMLNIALDPNIPDTDPRKIMAVQRLQRVRTYSTPEGTYTTPGYNLSEMSAPAPQGQPPQGQEAPVMPSTEALGGSPSYGTGGGSTFTPVKEKTPGWDAIDTNFAKENVAFSYSGGAADATKQIAQLNSVIDELESGSQNLTGPTVGRVPGFLNEVINPKAVDAKERVEEVVQRNLRLILGAQFTEKEGERLISRAYNPNLDEKINARRLRNLSKQMSEALKMKTAASAYFEKYGTLEGFQGKLPSISDFYVKEEDDAGGDDSGWSIVEE